MPANTSDPISSVLQKTFGGLDLKREGLMRGGNSASAKPSFNMDKQIQASAKHGLVTNSSSEAPISFDAPTSYKSEVKITNPKVIVLNPKARQAAAATNGNGVANNKSQTEQNPKEGIPQAKIILYSPSEIRVGYSQNRGSGAGMANAGNTCYLNSTLQALFHTPALFNYFQYSCASQHMSKCSSSHGANGFLQSCTICAMVHTLRDSMKTSVIRPNRIYEKLKIICKHMVHGRQEDAHEFLRYLIDSLQRSYLNTIPNSKNLDSLSKETTPFNQIFGGYMRQEVTCIRCKHVSTTFQHFMDILVDIQQSNTIEEALGQFFRQKKLGYPGDEASLYKCEKCKVKVQAKWQCFMEKPPPVLCIQLKRFSLLGGKIGKPIQLCRNLNIAPFLKASSPNGDVKYVLRSMITHVGPSPNCGHYTAIGESSNGIFYQFDDASVRPIPLQQVLRTASYVVFYEMTPSSWASQLGQKAANKPPIGPQRPPIGPQRPPPSATATSAPPTPSMSAKVPSNQPKIINKLGVVSSAAKSLMSNAFSDIAKSVSKPSATPMKKGLVPYGNDSDSSDVEEDKPKASPLPMPSFVPRQITVKKLVEPTVKALEKPIKQISATARNWTVTDVDHHNPSVNSDNSTGSTNGGWIIHSQNCQNQQARPSSAMSEDASSTKSSSKWTVTTLKKAIDEDATGKAVSSSSSSGASNPSTPSSSSSSKNSIGSRDDKPPPLNRKRPSLDDTLSDYDDEFDRGRTKKVKKITVNDYPSSNGANPFQKRQDWMNQSKSNNGHNYRSSNSNHRSSWYNGDNGRNQNHHNKKFYRNDHHVPGGDRRSSFSSSRDRYSYNNRDSYKRYGSNGGHHDQSHYRDHFHRRRSR